MHNVFDTMERQVSEECGQKTRRYLELLARIDINEPTAKDAKELGQLLEQLDKTPAQARADHAALMDLRHRLAWFQANADVSERIRQATAAVVAKQESNKEAMRQLRDELGALTREQNHRANMVNRHRSIGEELAQFAAADPLLYQVATAAAETVDKQPLAGVPLP